MIELYIGPLLDNQLGIDDGIAFGTNDRLCNCNALGSYACIVLINIVYNRDDNILVCDGFINLLIHW